MTEARRFRFFEIWQERRILWLDDVSVDVDEVLSANMRPFYLT